MYAASTTILSAFFLALLALATAIPIIEEALEKHDKCFCRIQGKWCHGRTAAGIDRALAGKCLNNILYDCTAKHSVGHVAKALPCPTTKTCVQGGGEWPVDECGIVSIVG